MRIFIVGPDSAIRRRLRDRIESDDFQVVGDGAHAPAGLEGDAIDVVVTIAEPLDGGPVTEFDDLDEALTPRELEVLELLSQGLSNKRIASRLGISDNTVKFHVSAILAKLRATSRTEAIAHGIRRGLITL